MTLSYDTQGDVQTETACCIKYQMHADAAAANQSTSWCGAEGPGRAAPQQAGQHPVVQVPGGSNGKEIGGEPAHQLHRRLRRGGRRLPTDAISAAIAKPATQTSAVCMLLRKEG